MILKVNSDILARHVI